MKLGSSLQSKLAFTLAALLLTGILFSCQNTSSAVDTAAIETKSSEESAETTEISYDPCIPAKDFDGIEFWFYFGDNDFEPSFDVRAEELNGEALNDAIFNRNKAIEEKYNVTVKWERNEYGAMYNKVAQLVRAGEDAVKVMINNGNYSFSAAVNGLTQIMNDVPYIDFSKPYWNRQMLKDSTVFGKNYFAYSDINIHALGATPCVLFNKVVAENYNTGNLYDVVKSGDWTFDYMTNLIKSVTGDLDGDGKITQFDMHGFIGNTFVIDCFLSGTGYQTISKNDEDFLELNIVNEKYYDIIAAIQSICSADNGSFICDRYSGVDREYAPMDALAEDRALFWIPNFKGVERMRGMKSEFGILPIPKLDSSQKEYKIHYQANIGGAMSIPITVRDIEMVGMILEDMSYLSMVNVKPAYVEILLQGKFLRDNESLEILEIIFDSYYCDYGFMTNASGIDILTKLREFVANNSTSYVSRIASIEKGYTKLLSKLHDTFLENQK